MTSDKGFSYRTWSVVLVLLLFIGCLQVFQRTAVIMKGYAVGSGVKSIHERATQVVWLESQVHVLRSPARLAAFARENKIKFVAREQLEPSFELKNGLIRLASISASLPQ